MPFWAQDFGGAPVAMFPQIKGRTRTTTWTGLCRCGTPTFVMYDSERLCLACACARESLTAGRTESSLR